MVDSLLLYGITVNLPVLVCVRPLPGYSGGGPMGPPGLGYSSAPGDILRHRRYRPPMCGSSWARLPSR